MKPVLMNKAFWWLLFAGFSVCSCIENAKPKRASTVKPTFTVDTSRPVIASGFYLVSEDTPTSIRRRLFTFLNEETITEEFYLDPANLIPFTAIESVSWREDTFYKNGFYVLDFRLNSQATKQLTGLSANANTMRITTPKGLRLGTVAANTLVQVATIPAKISNGVMELSHMFNQEDVENLKRNFDKAIAAAKSRQ